MDPEKYKSLTTEDLESKIASDAMLVMDACNLSGVVFGFARCMEMICELSHRVGGGTEFKNSHPVAVMFSEKIASLTNSPETEVFSKAYEWCSIKQKGGAQAG